MLADLAVQLRPVPDRAAHAAAVDEVKGVAGSVVPLALDVVDHEDAVGRHPLGLDGAEVAADDFGAGELVGEVEGPL